MMGNVALSCIGALASASLAIDVPTASVGKDLVSGWNVSGRDGSCSMLRPYSPEQANWVVFAHHADGKQFVRVHDDRWSVVKGRAFDATLTFDGAPTVIPATGAITDGAKRTGGFVASTDKEWQSNLATATRMTVAIPENAETIVDLTGVAAAFAAMRQCVEQARGGDTVALRSPLRLITGLTLSAADYPLELGDDRREGTAAVRLRIDTEGKPKGCEVVTSSGSSILDERSCALASARMRFAPAVAVDGKPTEGSYQFRVNWKRP